MASRIAVVSDTHGWIRPELLAAVQGAERILHAGDVGKPEVLSALQAIAPVTAVRGNIDRGEWALDLPQSEVVDMNGQLLYMLHDRHALDLDPAAAGFRAVISGHSHRPSIEWQKNVLYLNPGSAGPRRFSLPVSMALLWVDGQNLDAQLVELDN